MTKIFKFIQQKFDLVCLKRKMFKFYKELIKPDSLVFGVGANIGNRVEIF